MSESQCHASGLGPVGVLVLVRTQRHAVDGPAGSESRSATGSASHGVCDCVCDGASLRLSDLSLSGFKFKLQLCRELDLVWLQSRHTTSSSILLRLPLYRFK